MFDKLKYGNKGVSLGEARHELIQMSEKTIIEFIKKINNILLPSVHLFLLIDKFHLCQGILDWFIDTDLSLVDMIVLG